MRFISGILLLFYAMAFSLCSAIEAQWYSKPPCKYSHDVDGREFPSALIKLDGIEYEYWSNTGYFRTFYGPMLLPVIPNEPPIMNHQDLRLMWRIKPKAGTTLLVKKPGLILKTSKGKLVSPTGVRIDKYKVHNGKRYPDIHEYYSCPSGECPDVIEVKEEVLLELWYLMVRYAEEDWYETKAQLILDGEALDTPMVRFEPDRERNFTPFELPFGPPPVH